MKKTKKTRSGNRVRNSESGAGMEELIAKIAKNLVEARDSTDGQQSHTKGGNLNQENACEFNNTGGSPFQSSRRVVA